MQGTYTIWIPSRSTAGGSSPPQQLNPFCNSSSSGPPAGGSQASEHPDPHIWILSHPELLLQNSEVCYSFSYSYLYSYSYSVVHIKNPPFSPFLDINYNQLWNRSGEMETILCQYKRHVGIKR